MVKLLAILAATLAFYTSVEANERKSPFPLISPPVIKGSFDYTVEIITNVSNVAGLNKHGELAALPLNPQLGSYPGVLVDRKGNLNEFRCLVFDRPDERETLPTALNNLGTVTGGCSSGGTSFVRTRDGNLFQFSVPGADQTNAWAINDHGAIVGEYITPFAAPGLSGWTRVHSFLRTPAGQYTDINAIPHPDDVGLPDSLTRTWVGGINNRGQIVGTYSTIFLADNSAGMSGAFLYDNSNFTNIDIPGADNTIPLAINNHGLILLQADTIELSPVRGFYLYDDGRLYRIGDPPGWRWTGVEGLNDRGQLFGRVIQNGTGGGFPNPPPVIRQVIATPVKGK